MAHARATGGPPPPTDEGKVRVGDLDLHWIAWGDPGAPAVLLLHGGSAHARWWDFVAPALAARYRPIALDLRGHGDSDHALPPAYAIDDYAADVAGFARAHGLARYALVGHSLGGFVAITVAARHPGAVRALGVIDSRPVTGSGRSGLAKLALLPHPEYADAEEAIRRFRLLPRGTSARPEVLRHTALAGLRRTPRGTVTLKFDRQAFARRSVVDLGPALAALTCPTLLVRGGESTFLDRATLDQMADLCPRAEVAEIAGAYHHVMLDRPEALAARLAAFLDRHLARAR